MILDGIYCVINGVGILKDINFEFIKGNFYYITVSSEKLGNYLFDSIGLVSPIMEGKYIINGEDVSGYSYKNKATIRRENIGFIFKDIILDDDFNVFDNIMIPLINDKRMNKKEKINKVRNLLKDYNMEKYANKYPKEISLYDKQVVSFLRALVNEPKFVIACEPTELLREEEEKNFYKLLYGLKNKKIGVIVITRRVKFPKYADEIFCYENKFM